ncbi:hypothetical protein AYO45_01250 [Gammaproteobacteria bacterium SCGC AG-212-F23]|nr:hypothetical protein AYO45_01250 [Gammaproteobacteria bacterium SCGC AG-212-F23]
MLRKSEDVQKVVPSDNKEDTKFQKYMQLREAILKTRVLTLVRQAVICDVTHASTVSAQLKTTGVPSEHLNESIVITELNVPLNTRATLYRIEKLAKAETYSFSNAKASSITYTEIDAEEKIITGYFNDDDSRFKGKLEELMTLNQKLEQWLKNNVTLIATLLLEAPFHSMLARVIAEFKELFALAELHDFFNQKNLKSIKEHHKELEKYITTVREDNTRLKELLEKKPNSLLPIWKGKINTKAKNIITHNQNIKNITKQKEIDPSVWKEKLTKLENIKSNMQTTANTLMTDQEEYNLMQRRAVLSANTSDDPFVKYRNSKIKFITEKLLIQENSQKALIRMLELPDQEQRNQDKTLAELLNAIDASKTICLTLEEKTNGLYETYRKEKEQELKKKETELKTAESKVLDDNTVATCCLFTTVDTEGGEAFKEFYDLYSEERSKLLNEFKEEKELIQLLNNASILDEEGDSKSAHEAWDKRLMQFAKYSVTSYVNIYQYRVKTTGNTNFIYALIAQTRLLTSNDQNSLVDAVMAKNSVLRGYFAIDRDFDAILLRQTWKSLKQKHRAQYGDSKIPASKIQQIELSFTMDNKPISITLGELFNKPASKIVALIYNELKTRFNTENFTSIKDFVALDREIQCILGGWQHLGFDTDTPRTNEAKFDAKSIALSAMDIRKPMLMGYCMEDIKLIASHYTDTVTLNLGGDSLKTLKSLANITGYIIENLLLEVLNELIHVLLVPNLSIELRSDLKNAISQYHNPFLTDTIMKTVQDTIKEFPNVILPKELLTIIRDYLLIDNHNFIFPNELLAMERSYLSNHFTGIFSKENEKRLHEALTPQVRRVRPPLNAVTSPSINMRDLSSTPINRTSTSNTVNRTTALTGIHATFSTHSSNRRIQPISSPPMTATTATTASNSPAMTATTATTANISPITTTTVVNVSETPVTPSRNTLIYAKR